MKLSNNIYDFLAFLGKIVLPALAVLYATLADTWGLPYSNEISTTIMAIDVFLNALLGISSANFYKDTYQSTDEK